MSLHSLPTDNRDEADEAAFCLKTICSLVFRATNTSMSLFVSHHCHNLTAHFSPHYFTHPDPTKPRARGPGVSTQQSRRMKRLPVRKPISSCTLSALLHIHLQLQRSPQKNGAFCNVTQIRYAHTRLMRVWHRNRGFPAPRPLSHFSCGVIQRSAMTR